MGACSAEVVRGGFVDCVHRIAIAVTDAGGDVVLETSRAGDLAVFLRSAAKPFQAEPAVAAGVLEQLGLDDRHLAVACASHLGLDEHVARVAEILAAAGLEPANLRCGEGEARGVLGHNCSGNHALGLALCSVSGWEVAGYLDRAHPLQQAMRGAVARVAGMRPDEAVDGCGMRAYRLPLGRIAAMFGALATDQGSLGRCARAMRAHPQLVRGDGSIDTELMRETAGLVAKVGAEGVIGVGLSDGRGLALKVVDGTWRALEPAALHAVRDGLGIAANGDRLEPFEQPPVVAAHGVVVGEILVRIGLSPPKAS